MRHIIDDADGTAFPQLSGRDAYIARITREDEEESEHSTGDSTQDGVRLSGRDVYLSRLPTLADEWAKQYESEAQHRRMNRRQR